MEVDVEPLTVAMSLEAALAWATHWAPWQLSRLAAYIVGILILAIGNLAYAVLADVTSTPLLVQAGLVAATGAATILAYAIDALRDVLRERRALRKIAGRDK